METSNDRDQQARLRLTFLGLWTAGVLVLAAISLSPPFLPIYTHLGYGLFLDNVLHFLVFAAMAALTPYAFGRITMPGALCILLLLAFVLEGVQFFIPDHRADAVDFVAGVLGVIAGSAAGLLLKRLGERRMSRSGA
jgi:VanZ family protein